MNMMNLGSFDIYTSEKLRPMKDAAQHVRLRKEMTESDH